MKKFWMVYLEGCRAPVFKHRSERSAMDEAYRLAGEHNLDAFVLEAKTVIKIVNIPTTVFEKLKDPDEDKCPF